MKNPTRLLATLIGITAFGQLISMEKDTHKGRSTFLLKYIAASTHISCWGEERSISATFTVEGSHPPYTVLNHVEQLKTHIESAMNQNLEVKHSWIDGKKRYNATIIPTRDAQKTFVTIKEKELNQ